MSNESDRVMHAPANGVKVRMYRQGLGDCFLLAFPTADPQQSYYVLIDCGVLTGTKGGAKLMQQVADDIYASTNNGQIHLLVVTHRHWDHIAGFSYAAQIFSKMTVHNLWLPWAESDDQKAKDLWHKTGQAMAALAGMTQREPMATEHVRQVLRFTGLGMQDDKSDAGDGDAGDGDAAGRPDPVGGGPGADDDPLLPVRKLLKPGATPQYWQPNAGPLTLPDVPGLPPAQGAMAYVMGPPLLDEQLEQMNPSKAGQETYLTAIGLASQLAFGLGLKPGPRMSEDEWTLAEMGFPFDQHLRIKNDDARQIAFFQEHYGFGGQAGGSVQTPAAMTKSTTPGEDTGPSSATSTAAGGAAGPDAGSSPEPPPGPPAPAPAPAPDAETPGPAGPAWRRIETDWMAGAEELALQLDNIVNNTSLVLAFELVKSKKVLLFVGDAQVGNWLSWHDMTWQRPDGSQVKAEQLLANTVLYKVGHHGSQNATMQQLAPGKPYGLELMKSPDLVAMLPVDEVFANQPRRYWRFPYQDMYKALKQRTRLRIIRIDAGVPAEKPVDPDASVDDATWQAFVKNVYPYPPVPYPPGVPAPTDKDPKATKRDKPIELEIPYIEFTVME